MVAVANLCPHNLSPLLDEADPMGKSALSQKRRSKTIVKRLLSPRFKPRIGVVMLLVLGTELGPGCESASQS